jgi:hypothetical protein
MAFEDKKLFGAKEARKNQEVETKANIAKFDRNALNERKALLKTTW